MYATSSLPFVTVQQGLCVLGRALLSARYNEAAGGFPKKGAKMSLHSRIFVALDGSSTQDFVSRKAIEVADHNEAELIFGHVIDSVPYEASGVDFEELCAEAEQRIRTDLAEVFEMARKNPRIKSVELEVRAGRVADTLIARLIEPCNPDLVICGERGLSNFKYAFVGSVSTNLVRGVACDVLVVKTEANAAKNAPKNTPKR